MIVPTVYGGALLLTGYKLNNPIHSLTCSSYFGLSRGEARANTNTRSMKTMAQEKKTTKHTGNDLRYRPSRQTSGYTCSSRGKEDTGTSSPRSAATFAKDKNAVKGGKIITVNIFRFIKIWLFCVFAPEVRLRYGQSTGHMSSCCCWPVVADRDLAAADSMSSVACDVHDVCSRVSFQRGELIEFST